MPSSHSNLFMLTSPVARLWGVRAPALPAWLALVLMVATLLAPLMMVVTFRDVRTMSGTDLWSRVVASRLMLQGDDPYVNRQDESTPDFVYDPDRVWRDFSRIGNVPPTLLFYAPFANLHFQTQKPLWWAMEWGAMLASLALLARVVPGSRRRAWFVVVALVFFVCDFTWRLHVQRGQFYAFVLLGISLASWALLRPGERAKRPVLAGIALGLAASMRPTLALLTPALLAHKRWKAGLAMGLTGLACVLATVPLVGVEGWRSSTQVARAFMIDTVRGRTAGKELLGAQPPTQRRVIEGADFTKNLPANKTVSVSVNRVVPLVLMALKRPVPHELLERWTVPLGAGVALTGVALTWGWRLRRYGWRGLATLRGTRWLLAGSLLSFMLLDFHAPQRFGYVDILWLPVLALAWIALVPARRSVLTYLPLAIILAGLLANLVAPGAYVAILRNACLTLGVLLVLLPLLLRAPTLPAIPAPRRAGTL